MLGTLLIIWDSLRREWARGWARLQAPLALAPWLSKYEVEVLGGELFSAIDPRRLSVSTSDRPVPAPGTIVRSAGEVILLSFKANTTP